MSKTGNSHSHDTNWNTEGKDQKETSRNVQSDRRKEFEVSRLGRSKFMENAGEETKRMKKSLQDDRLIQHRTLNPFHCSVRVLYMLFNYDIVTVLKEVKR